MFDEFIENAVSIPVRRRRFSPRILAGLGVALALGLSGCGTAHVAPLPGRGVSYPIEALSAELSPRPERVGPFEGLRLAEAYVATHPGTDYMVGSGNSMLPLYRSHTVLVLEKRPLAELKRGMTVVYVADQGHPVAHTLAEKTPRGWIAMGLGNRRPDRALVSAKNYIGVVIRAYEPSENPMVAILRRPTATAAGAE